MPPTKTPSREILVEYQHSGASWQAVDRETVRSLIQIAVDSGTVLTENIALADYHYWINRGDVKPYRYYAKRWGWGADKAYRFVRGLIKQASSNDQASVKQETANLSQNQELIKQASSNDQASVKQCIEIPDNKIPDKRKKHNCSPELESQVEALYNAYPKKVAKPKAMEAIRKALGQAPYETILAGVQRYAEETKGRDRQFIAYPASWFNAGRWDDEPEPVTTKHGASNGQPQKPTSSYERRMQTTVPGFLENLERQRDYKPEPFFKPVSPEPPAPDSGGLRLVSGRSTGSDKG